MSRNDGKCNKKKPQKEVTVELKKIVDKIDLPIAITFATLPGDSTETMFVATQVGEIIAIQGNKARVFLNIKDRVLKLGIKKTPYDERGLLGLAFHPDFTKNGKFYLYYSQCGSQHKPPTFTPVNPCDKKSLKQEWDKCDYDHIDTLEEWLYSPKPVSSQDMTDENRYKECKLHKELLSICQPFFNNNGRDNLVFSPAGNLMLGLGDGGGSLDPYNLAQNKDSLLGKLLSIDLEKLCVDCDVYPVSYYSELLPCQRKGIRTVVSGVHNTSHPAYDKKSIENVTYLSNTGETGSEAVYAYDKPKVNLGWRAWEGALPTTKEEPCNVTGEDARMVVLWDYDGFPKTGEGLEIKIKEGDTVGFLTNDSHMVHAVALADHNWELAGRSRSKYYIKPSKNLQGNIKFSEVGEYCFVDPYCERRMKLKIKVSANHQRKDNCRTQDCVVFVKESLYIENRHLPLVNLHHKNEKKSVNEITGGEFYKGLIEDLKDSYVFSDLSQRCVPEGSLFYVRAGENLEKLQKAQKINIEHKFHNNRHFFVSLGTNKDQDKLYLGVYGSLGVKDSKLGAVYEIVSHDHPEDCKEECSECSSSSSSSSDSKSKSGCSCTFTDKSKTCSCTESKSSCSCTESKSKSSCSCTESKSSKSSCSCTESTSSCSCTESKSSKSSCSSLSSLTTESGLTVSSCSDMSSLSSESLLSSDSSSSHLSDLTSLSELTSSSYSHLSDLTSSCYSHLTSISSDMSEANCDECSDDECSDDDSSDDDSSDDSDDSAEIEKASVEESYSSEVPLVQSSSNKSSSNKSSDDTTYVTVHSKSSSSSDSSESSCSVDCSCTFSNSVYQEQDHDQDHKQEQEQAPSTDLPSSFSSSSSSSNSSVISGFTSSFSK